MVQLRFVFVLVLVAGCVARPRPPSTAVEVALRREVARLELGRAASVDALIAMVRSGVPERARLAARALGRVGTAPARAALLAELGCGVSSPCRPGWLAEVAAALGVMVAIDELDGPGAEEIARGLLAAWPRVPAGERAVVLEALGRGGDAAAQPVLIERLGAGGAEAEAAAIALGRHGRRSIAWSDGVRAAVVAASSHADPALRYAATWALARESSPPAAGDDRRQVIDALVARLSDGEPEVRAMAAAAIGRRKLASDAVPALTQAARDRDWRVAVEAVRGLASARELPGVPAALVAVARAHLGAAAAAPAGLQVAVEALRAVAAWGQAPEVAQGLGELLRALPEVMSVSATAVGHLRCWALAGLARSGSAPDFAALAGCGGKELAAAYAVVAVLDAVTGKVGAPEARRAAVAELLAASDARVVAAALPALAVTAAEASEPLAASDVDRVAVAVASPDPILAGVAIEVAAKLAPAPPEPRAPWQGAPAVVAAIERLVVAVIARAARERDPELAGALLAFIADRRLAAGLAACRAAAAERAAVIARAGRRCVAALGQRAPEPAPVELAPAPVELALGLPTHGRPWRWLVTTNHGEVEIELDSAAAPWHVAAIVELTRRGAYDGIDFHRVVPDFVVQGGDPTESGSGGPGFFLPAEPGSSLDGGTFATGAVGFADAGKDSGGSQWFVMHGRAPHLEGRYTRVGRVVRGQAVVDRLLVGDHVVTARVLGP